MKMAGISHWITNNNDRDTYKGFDGPFEIEEAIKDDLKRIRVLDLFLPSPWNHVTVTLSNSGHISMKYAYIEEIDHWPNLHMKGVSDLGQREAQEQHGVPPADWLYIANEVLKIRQGEAEAASIVGNEALLADLTGKIVSLQGRIEAADLRD